MKEEIYNLLESNDLEKAIKRFLEVTRGNTKFYQIAMTLNTSYKQFEQESLLGLNVQGKQNEIISRLISALDKFQPEETKLNTTITKTITVPTSEDFEFTQTISNDGISISRDIEKENISRSEKKIEKLNRQILETEELIEAWENKRRLAENPNEKLRSEKEIEKLEKIMEEYELKLGKLQSDK